MDINTELERISKETGVTKEDLKKDMDTLVAKGHTEAAALAITKSGPRIRNRLGGRVIEAVLVPFSVEEPREVNTKSGLNKVATVDAFMQAESKWSAVSMAFWGDENVGKAAAYAVGKPVTNKVRVRDGTDRVSPIEEPQPSSATVPTPAQLAEQIGLMPLNDLKGIVGESCFVKGIVGALKNLEGKNFMIANLDAIGSNPITVFLPASSQVKLGDEVVVYGRVNEREGEVSIWGSLL